MILSNYWKWLDLILKNSFGSGSSDTATGMKDVSGNTGYMDMSSDTRAINCRDFNDGSIYLGSGDDEITANDYAMSDDCTSNIGNLNYTINSAGTDEGLARTITITGYNASESELTITEAGYAKRTVSYNHSTQYIIMAKTKLNEPLTVPSGSNFLINLAWNEV